MDAVWNWLWPAYDQSKCKVNLKSAISRMKLRKVKKREEGLKHEREVGVLMKQEKEELAYLKVEQLLRDKRLVAAFDLLELMCEVLASRIGVITAVVYSKEVDMSERVPRDLREAIYSIIWVSLRVQIPEFKVLAEQFKLKFGEAVFQAALVNKDGFVNDRLADLLSVKPPNAEEIDEYMDRLWPTGKSNRAALQTPILSEIDEANADEESEDGVEGEGSEGLHFPTPSDVNPSHLRASQGAPKDGVHTPLHFPSPPVGHQHLTHSWGPMPSNPAFPYSPTQQQQPFSPQPPHHPFQPQQPQQPHYMQHQPQQRNDKLFLNQSMPAQSGSSSTNDAEFDDLAKRFEALKKGM